MKFRAIRSATMFYILPAITLIFDKTWYGHYEVGFVWFNWYLCLEWGNEN